MTAPNPLAAIIPFALLLTMTLAIGRISPQRLLPVIIHNGVWRIALLVVPAPSRLWPRLLSRSRAYLCMRSGE